MYRVYIIERRTWQMGLAVLALAVAALAARSLPALGPSPFSSRSWSDGGEITTSAGLGSADRSPATAPTGSGSVAAVPQRVQPGPAASAAPGTAPEQAGSAAPSRPNPTPAPSPRALFESYRLERERQRSRQVELLRQLIDDPATQPAQRQSHQEQLLRIWRQAEKETQAEQVLKARGYQDALVILSDNGANVVVPVVLTREEAARVGEAVARAVGLSQEQVIIVDAATPRR